MNQFEICCFFVLISTQVLLSAGQCKDDKWKKWESCGGCKKSRKRECLADENITERRDCVIGKTLNSLDSKFMNCKGKKERRN